MLGSLIPDAKLVSAIVPLVFIPLILFSGFYKNRDTLPVWIGWLEFISPYKYAFEAFATNEFES